MIELLMYPPFMGILAGTVIAVVAILSAHWRSVREAELETALKRDMVERGMSADEIAQVVETSPRAKSRR